jgi:hypothetical protein
VCQEVGQDEDEARRRDCAAVGGEEGERFGGVGVGVWSARSVGLVEPIFRPFAPIGPPMKGIDIQRVA